MGLVRLTDNHSEDWKEGAVGENDFDETTRLGI
jgi:hypothetical protein